MKIAFVVTNSSLENRIKKMDLSNHEIEIFYLNQDNTLETLKRVSEFQPDGIISRRSGYGLMEANFHCPVVLLDITTIDILKKIKESSFDGYHPLIALWNDQYFDIKEWNQFLQYKVDEIRFSSPEGAKDLVEKLDSNHWIIGSGMICKIAKENGICNTYIGPSDESIIRALNELLKRIETLRTSKLQSTYTENVLSHVVDGVIHCDVDGRIIDVNQAMCNLMALGRIGLLNKEVNSLFKKQLKNGEVIKFKGKTLRVTISKVESEMIYVFSDITKIQALEKQVRLKLNRKRLEARWSFEGLVSVEPNFLEVIEKAKVYSQYDNATIIYGESGTGKEVFAQSIHNFNHRSEGPFIAVNCAAIPENLLESELFGYENGAFTGARKNGKAGYFELAHGGTIFLDEINSMPLSVQSKLLRVIEEKEIMRLGSDYIISLDVRIIAASNAPLYKMCQKGTFRKDLYFRLAELSLSLPTLAQRKNDILPLFESFVGAELKLKEEEVDLLLDYHWPGNIRELKNVAMQYKLMGRLNLNENRVKEKKPLDIKELHKTLEKEVIQEMLDKGYSKREVADRLSLSRTAIWTKLSEN